MSERDVPVDRRRAHHPAPPSGVDGGMTLVEVVVSLAIIGIVTLAISGVVVATLRQQDNTEGRLNVARAEQSIGMWFPADLASADTIDTSPSASPCGAPTCDGVDLSTGSNVLLLTWTTTGPSGPSTTAVSYHFRPQRDGRGFELVRVECTSGACAAQQILRDLPGPPGGAEFVPGVPAGAGCETSAPPCTRPDWVVVVSEPVAPDAVDTDGAPTATNPSTRKDANRITVTVNGGGDTDGAGGGINQVSITAGGTVRRRLDPNGIVGTPTFVEARSRCGGPMTLIVDDSGSIGRSLPSLQAGVRRFVEVLAGTPVQLQIVRFDNRASVLGTAEWHRYVDMTDTAAVAGLLDAIGGLEAGGGTNWEEALFRTFFAADGTTAPLLPETVVFFTDGVPTRDRLQYRSEPGALPAFPPPPGPEWAAHNGSPFSQVAFDRADHIATQFRPTVRLIGVGVGAGITSTSTWVEDPGAGYRWVWERAARRYQHVVDGDTTWVTAVEYAAGNSTPDATDGWIDTGGEEYVTASEAVDWIEWPGDRIGPDDQYRSRQVYGEPPYDGYDDAVTAVTGNDVILSRLISASDRGVPAVWDSGRYVNAEVADMYVLPTWTQFGAAMESVALGACGGTLTLRTQLPDGSVPATPFHYQQRSITDSGGVPLDAEQSVVTTSRTSTSGTFDLPVPDGQHVTVEVLPQVTAEVAGFTPGAWTCRVGVAERAAESIPLEDAPGWTGVRVRVGANEAVSCRLEVSR